jgi:hypothetical protein
MDDIEQLLEGGKAEAAAQKANLALSPSNGHRDRSGDEVSSFSSRPMLPEILMLEANF